MGQLLTNLLRQLLGDSETDNTTLKYRVSSLRKQLITAKQQMVEYQTEVFDLQRQLERSSTDKETSKKQLREERGRVIDLERQLSTTKQQLFIGATNDEGSQLFVTELMESSLRALLEQRPLSCTDISVISLDIAQALTYLHRNEPPIIHRDISSANVLLWRHGDQWRGKVSDHGTANFMPHTKTIGPGATIYSSPEALTPNQTVKLIWVGLGVMMNEMTVVA
ncbi:calmodulin-binding receptor-like cytoplasmic kinase 2 [Orbicella faveolata]|uniref:calmodulin-binding receptor-like cytoplasmic kinase 2 n=1 Tax=Orbicella faveolata TaxID=48498 RepID=UPI0009E5559A|nr:calmodulin-binding receptor-like cytoplasmic kinase 2 [Orbicella faveolata]